ncbi:glycosyltransferase family 2 protein [Jiella sp. M17.18]|uniref:glycosyltransferase family 2 protein n=1 Tax=Jiella sp. M17.18 TaxID=3234247 RepID=UPI0034DDF9B8
MHDNSYDVVDSHRAFYASQPPGRNGRIPASALRSAPSPTGGRFRPRFDAKLAQPFLASLILSTLDIGPETVAAAAEAASRNGTDIAAELLVAGDVEETTLAAAMAAALDLPFEDIGEADEVLGAERLVGRPPPRILKTCDDRLDAKLFLVPRLERLDALAAHLQAWPSLRRIARVTTTSDVRAAIERQTLPERWRAAVLSLSADEPILSARTVLTAAQAAALVLAVTFAAAAAVAAPRLMLDLVHASAGLLFGGCLAFRCAALAGPQPQLQPVSPPALPDEPLPVYSVLVALHHETTVVPHLVEALAALDWPASRLEIRLVCEADDVATIRAVRAAIRGRPQFAVIEVPPSEPRTKPKALNTALPLVSGEFVVLYDAEDEPDPGQLKEAYRAFRTGPAGLACVQAPLVIRNGQRNWLAGVFALEYAALFRRILPWLASHGLPLPLGGTSNHFVRAHLVAAGGWDSHNVTEDADLGLRLVRKGFRVGTITRPTFEDAPERLTIWYRQRTRWLKGWFQTYLLHMREPRRLLRELGMRRMAAFQLLFLGMLASSLVHPIFLGIVALFVTSLVDGALKVTDLDPLFVLDLINAAGGYGVFIALSGVALDARERRTLPRFYPYLPLYWLLVACAGLRAFRQLFFAPHNWEKTPHGIEARMDFADPRHRVEPVFDGGEAGWA